jgi:glycosyltransferase involved in cell wall biosynthesis
MKATVKTAIIHDVFIEKGGAERVFLSLLEMYPTADVYIPLLSVQHIPQIQKKTSGKIFTSFLNKIPFVHSASVLLKPLLFLYWEYLDLSDYDLVITSSHSFSSKAVITSPDTHHVSYVHTSPRYLYTEYNETRVLKKKLFRVLLLPMLSWLRSQDFLAAQRPDVLVANSKVVQRRIQKYYRRSSIIIPPPVKLPVLEKKLKKVESSAQYFLCHSRLAKQKGIDLAILACNELQLSLVVVGRGSQEAYLRSIAGPTVQFRGFVPDEEMSAVYAGAKALIYCSIEEDFGLVPVEAMAHGVPVIGYRSGGTAETVLHLKTGLLFDEYTVEELKKTLKTFAKKKLSAKAAKQHAKKYAEEQFKRKMKKVIDNAY